MRTFNKKIVIWKFATVSLAVVVLVLSTFFYRSLKQNTGATLAEPTALQNLTSLLPEASRRITENRDQVLETGISKVVADKIGRHDASEIAVYVYDLSSGRSALIDRDGVFAPGSLFKAPILIAYLKLAETQPDTLRKTLIFDSPVNENLTEYIRPTRTLMQGQTYSVITLLRGMIIRSGNNSKDLLLSNVDQDFMIKVFEDLGISIAPRGVEDFLKVKTFADILKTLYETSYLNQDMSERAFGLLAQVEYRNGLVAGVPPNTTVAHKFGERFVGTPNGKSWKEFHDCGIIYKPDKPYILCVMTKGQSYPDQENVIQDISRFVYGQI